MSLHNYTATSIEGKTINFADFKGKMVLLVNVASACGYTKQYEQLQALYEHGALKGRLEIVGFPSNEFGGQEPGSEAEILAFCQTRFGVTFPLTQKTWVKAKTKKHPVYEFLTQKALNDVDDYEVTWNFWKFLCDEDGDLMDVFAPDEMSELTEYLLAEDEDEDTAVEQEDDNAFHFHNIWFFPEGVEIPFDEKTLQIITLWVNETITAEGQSCEELRIVFCSDEAILDLNKQILQHDFYTDVITCPLSEPDEPLDADIYISTDRTADNAKTLNVPPKHELCRVIIHSVLHLCGYDDATPELRNAMHEKENFYLEKLTKVYSIS